MRPAGLLLALGLAAAVLGWLGARTVRTMLFEIQPNDSWILGGGAILAISAIVRQLRAGAAGSARGSDRGAPPGVTADVTRPTNDYRGLPGVVGHSPTPPKSVVRSLRNRGRWDGCPLTTCRRTSARISWTAAARC